MSANRGHHHHQQSLLSILTKPRVYVRPCYSLGGSFFPKYTWHWSLLVGLSFGAVAKVFSVPMNAADKWMAPLSVFWLNPESHEVRRRVPVQSMQECNEMGHKKSPSLKSSWRQLICVDIAARYYYSSSTTFLFLTLKMQLRQIRIKKGNFQLVFVSFKRYVTYSGSSIH